ncbi:hypothetical protein [Beijerinckia sp. L45]|uniref:hypothetical protein n=1 Tax=Beijerinckia sp. L45 TaxID=1641855 RepID=UPI00131C085D|nr:hypothetical protein [Beijerinckia sp. L45]
MIADDIALSPDPSREDEPASVSLFDLQVAFTTLLHVHDTISDLKARCLSVADIENANRMIRTLEGRLNGYQGECKRLAESLQEAERRTRIYRRRSEDAETKLASLQRTISQRLIGQLIEDDVSGTLPLEPSHTQHASPAS